MAYTDFDSAFSQWSAIFVDVRDSYLRAVDYILPIYFAEDFAALRQATADFADEVCNWMYLATDCNQWQWQDSSLYSSVYFAHGAGMDAIIAAMLDADYEQVSDFISINWAYQQILWDQPFFPDKYTDLINTIRT